MREKVMEAVRDLALSVNVVSAVDPARRSAEQAAAAVGCDRSHIAKAIVFVADGDPVVCVTSSTHRVDPDRLCHVLDCAEAREATPAEVRAATGFPVGGVSPFGHGVPVVFDEALLERQRIWVAGGDCNSLVEVESRACVERTGATVAAVSGRARVDPPA